MTSSELAAKIDHTILKPEATAMEVQQNIAEARQHQFASVCVAPIWVATVAEGLQGTNVLTCTVTAFPHGTSKATVKAIEATSSVKEGADEVDVVAHLPYLMQFDLDAARAELIEVVRAVRAARKDVVVKVIVESAALLKAGNDAGERSLEVACRAVRESGCDFIKTSTGFHPAGGASLEAVRLMKKYGQGLLVKASGGIRDLPTALAMFDAGADRLGMSASVAVVDAMA
ncbi:MAG TPA: deoxyribose-phosphate aldolase [Tepidisphaeraceae bacterium]|jgi:deoxyribose-phosphate aldolase|nr:deoxyribose-phosphate aldolase [Tepidisphaeraceae bacterium]